MTVHLALDELLVSDLPLGLPIGPWRRDRGGDSGPFFHQAIRERGDETAFGAIEPGVEIDRRLAPDHILEPGDEIAGSGEERDAALDCGDRDGFRFRQIMAASCQLTRDRPS